MSAYWFRIIIQTILKYNNAILNTFWVYETFEQDVNTYIFKFSHTECRLQVIIAMSCVKIPIFNIVLSARCHFRPLSNYTKQHRITFIQDNISLSSHASIYLKYKYFTQPHSLFSYVFSPFTFLYQVFNAQKMWVKSVR